MNVIKIVAVLVGIFHGTYGLRCYSCEGIACSRTTISKTEECADNLSLCMTVNTKNYGVFAKGCDETLSEETKNTCNEKDVECLACNTDLCNNVGSSSFQCIQCNSNLNNNCASNANTLRPSQCDIPSAAHSFCYARQHSNGTVERGCSLTTKHQKDCFDTRTCRICSPEDLPGCNDMTFDSTGTGTPAPPPIIPPPTIPPPPVTNPITLPPPITNPPPPPPVTTTTLPPDPITTKKPGSATSNQLSAVLMILLMGHIVFN